ncbi:hypothetical protein A2U01_0058491, partial [Trifolium medium]|nr:hypothetical protein [Trifolium medium]
MRTGQALFPLGIEPGIPRSVAGVYREFKFVFTAMYI